MENDNTSFVYSPPVVEFMTVAVRTCLFLEQQTAEETRDSFVGKLLRLLPVLYVKTLLVSPPDDGCFDGFLERFCTEEQYDAVRNGVAVQLADDDAYLSLPVEDGRYGDICQTRSVSEDVADIYQELKDMVQNYRLHDESVMEEAVVACLSAFREHWGIKLLDALRALHVINRDEDISVTY